MFAYRLWKPNALFAVPVVVAVMLWYPKALFHAAVLLARLR